jgi:hypothetical protein
MSQCILFFKFLASGAWTDKVNALFMTQRPQGGIPFSSDKTAIPKMMALGPDRIFATLIKFRFWQKWGIITQGPIRIRGLFRTSLSCYSYTS